MSEPDDEPFDDYADEESRCHTCGGEGLAEDDDDWQSPTYGKLVICWNCKGSGLSKDCWLW